MTAALLNPAPIVFNVARARERVDAQTMDVDGDGRVQAGEVFDYIRDIRDPEHPYTLEQLKVVEADRVWVDEDGPNGCLICIEFCPTVPHCSLASLIGLCLRYKLAAVMSKPFKLDISVTKGRHATEAEINKQVNDKERVAAALENPSLLNIVRSCVGES